MLLLSGVFYVMEARVKHVMKKEEKEENKILMQKMLLRYGKDILESDNFKETEDYIQHGSMSVRQHSINVAKCSLLLNEMLKLNCQKKDLVRGALLHDYFLYDWHDKNREDRKPLHGFYHPGVALENAQREYALTKREADIIKKHMWPLTVKPPLCREAWIVTTADKYCSLLETLHIQKRKKHRGSMCGEYLQRIN